MCPTVRFVSSFAGLVLATVVAGPVRAADDLVDRFSATAELGVGGTLARFRQDDNFSGSTLQMGLRGNLDIAPQWALTLSLRSWSLPSNNTALFFLMPGARYDAWTAPFGALRLDGALGLASTGGGTKIGFDLGSAFEFNLLPVPGMSLGPVLRYMQAFNSGSYSDDGKAWSLGASLTYHFGLARAATGPRQVSHVDVPRARSVASLVDSDGDGLKDDVDVCPNAVPGTMPDRERPGCPIGDRDGDGIPDAKDNCPDDAVGTAPDLGRSGCPAPDADHDGVRDAEDACPGKAGVPTNDVKTNGCPSDLITLAAGKLDLKKPITFAKGKDRILDESNPVLDAVASAIKATPRIKKIAIQGHTDNQGNSDKNLELSQRRADAVRTALIKLGVAADRLEAQGFGASQPISSNKTTAGRAANRRVEFVLLE